MELVTRASDAAFSSDYEFLKWLRKWLQLLSSLLGSFRHEKTANPRTRQQLSPCANPLSVQEGSCFLGEGNAGAAFLAPRMVVSSRPCRCSPSAWHQQFPSRLQSVYRRSVPSSPTTRWVRAEKCKWQCTKNASKFRLVCQGRNK